MLREGRLAEADRRGEAADRHLAGAGKLAEHQEPAFVGEELQETRGCARLFGEPGHVDLGALLVHRVH